MALQDQLDLIKRKRDEAINSINKQRTIADDSFYGQRNNVDTEMNQELAMQKDALARSGWSQGGENLGVASRAFGNRGLKLMDLRNKRNEYMQGLDKQISEANLLANEQEVKAKMAEEEKIRQEQERARQIREAQARRAAAAKKKVAQNLTPMDWAKRELNSQMRNGTAAEWLSQYRQPVMDAIGSKNFTALVQRKNNLRSQSDMNY